MKRRIIALLLGAVMAASVLAGCGSSGGSSETASSGSVETGADTADTQAGANDSSSAAGAVELTIGSGQTCQTLDPTYDYDGWYALRYGVCQTLTRMTDDFGIEGWLAESYAPNDDNTVWTFTLQDGITFSNGDACDAAAVRDCLEYIFANSNRAPETSFFAPESIEADGLVLTITTASPEPILPNKLADPLFAVFDVSALTDDPADDGVIGTGPFVYESFDAASRTCVVVKNDAYWNGAVAADRITFMYTEDQNVLTMGLQSEDGYDAVYNVSMTDIGLFENDSAYTVSRSASGRTAHGFMNQSEGSVLSDPVLRQAIMMCVDKATVCAVQLNGQYEPGVTPVTSAAPDYGYASLEDPYAYDPDAAAAMLDDAGYLDIDGDGFRETPDGEAIDIGFTYYTGRPEQQIFVEAVQTLAAQYIGIRITPVQHDTATVMDELDQGSYDMLMMSINVLNMADPENHFNEYFKTGGAHAAFGWDNAEFTAIMDELSVTAGTEAREALVTQASQILLDDAVCMFFCYPVINFTMRSNVTGLEQTPADYYWVNETTTVS